MTTTTGKVTNGSVTSNGHAIGTVHTDGMPTIELSLHIADPDLYSELSKREEPERSEFAISAMKIGIIAFRHSPGQIDAHQVRKEGERIIEDLGDALDKHQNEVVGQISDSLKQYFDPTDGSFSEKVRGLVEEDGVLEKVIKGQIQGDDSQLAKTLAAHVGASSPLMQVLNPESTGGLITQLTKSTEEALAEQRKRILSEFSLDSDESALSRLIRQLKENHGDVGKALEGQIEAVVAEFSLDKEDSALTRMRKELLDGIEKHQKTNAEFQSDVTRILGEIAGQKKESKLGTRHGVDFETAVFDFINEKSQKAGDIASHTGSTTGLIKNNKKGDVVIELGPEHVASGAKIVIEAKEKKGVRLQDALNELEEARKNRGADVGIFVFSQQTVPEGLESFARYGNDIVVVWDTEALATDVVLDAGISIAKALSTQSKSHDDEVGEDIKAIEESVLVVEKQIKQVDDIATWAKTISSNSEKILKNAEKARDNLVTHVATLNDKVGALSAILSE